MYPRINFGEHEASALEKFRHAFAELGARWIQEIQEAADADAAPSYQALYLPNQP
jgi:hypothetical protein